MKQPLLNEMPQNVQALLCQLSSSCDYSPLLFSVFHFHPGFICNLINLSLVARNSMANNNTETKGYAPFDLYPYNPSQGPAFAFLGFFSVVCLLHLVAMIPYRSFFPLPLVIGCGSM
jgi:hypothetical protein